MPTTSVLSLAECSPFYQALRNRPSRFVHGTALILVLLLATAVMWGEFTKANLVVRGNGQIRPLTPPQKVFLSGRTEVLSASTGGRVISVHYVEGQMVNAGDVLIRLETGRVDNEIEQKKKVVATTEGEWASSNDSGTRRCPGQGVPSKVPSRVDRGGTRDERSQAAARCGTRARHN